jgi:ABC-type sugar transport system substrate-binding protein
MALRRLLAVALLMLVAAVVLAACGGGGSSSSSETSGSESSETAEGAAGGETEPASEESEESEGGGGKELVENPSESPPTGPPEGLEPLNGPVPEGINVVNLQCDIPTCAGYSKTFQEIGKKYNWKVKTIVFKTGQPQDAMTQAVNTPGVEYVNISGVTTSIIKPQLKIATEKGIKVIKGEDPGPAEPPTVPVAISTAIGNSENAAEGLMNWIINDSGGKADVVVIGLPEIPTVQPTPKTAERVAKESCPECHVEELPLTGEELAAGTGPAKVVAYLQAHPETNYVWGAFGNLTLGVPQAIKTAGYAEKVKVVSMNGIEPAEAQALANGEMAAYNVSAQGEYSTMAADAIMRDKLGMKFPTKVYEEAPQNWLCTPETAEECGEWETFPEGYIDGFYELWEGK